ncbi:MAG TPA: acyl-CoA synthetase FdrA [Chloroflexota bacterium]|nr:acyl-CoA synthetase FdrA [Chloroflexota bacterium]
MTKAIARVLVFPHTYRDSVEMMRLASLIEREPGVKQVAAVMATPANRALLEPSGLLIGAARQAGPDDLVIAVLAADENAATAALTRAQTLLAGQAELSTGDSLNEPPASRSLDGAVDALPGANLALISVPGPYAAAEALKALKRGLNVFLFSDNVTLDDEVRLKRLAIERGLLLMGPDCGTAILDGIPVGFANVVRTGPIGVISASGTGLQSVTCLIDRQGSGISQAIGVGGRDLSAAVGGLMMCEGIQRLGRDPETRIIVLISKPPSAAGLANVGNAVSSIGKPVVACFIGAPPGSLKRFGLEQVDTLEEAARLAVALSGNAASDRLAIDCAAYPAPSQPFPFTSGQRFVRGLFAGGTLAHEAHLLLRERLGLVAEIEEGNPGNVGGHAVVDLGADAFTVGRAHPMIDARLRAEWIVATAHDPSVAVILFDVILGFGSHADPAGTLQPAILEAQRVAAADGRMLAFIASVCGTTADPQGLALQEDKLRSAGVWVAPSNAAAARWTLAALGEDRKGD